VKLIAKCVIKEGLASTPRAMQEEYLSILLLNSIVNFNKGSFLISI